MTVEAIAVGPVAAPDREAPRFRDAKSGCTFYVTTPDTHPDLWIRYLDGALRTYRHYGVENAVEYDATVGGGSTSLFFAAVSAAGEVVAGVRTQGPYLHADEVHALSAWYGHPGEAAFRRMICERIPQGLVEVKAVWVARGAAQRRALGAAVARCVVHAALLHGARFAMVTAAAHAIGRYRSSGAVVGWQVPAVPYPDERYRTVPLWWDTRNYRSIAGPLQSALISAEQGVLSATGGDRPGSSGAGIRGRASA
jgi:hypothetical protein